MVSKFDIILCCAVYYGAIFHFNLLNGGSRIILSSPIFSGFEILGLAFLEILNNLEN